MLLLLIPLTVFAKRFLSPNFLFQHFQKLVPRFSSVLHVVTCKNAFCFKRKCIETQKRMSHTQKTKHTTFGQYLKKNLHLDMRSVERGICFIAALGYNVYTVFQKKLVHQSHIDNLVNFQRIFKILSLTHSAENLL